MSRHHENLNHQLVAAYVHLSSGAQSCTYHFHLMMDCCQPHQSLRPGGSRRIQLMMSSSLYIVSLWPQSIIQGPVYRKMVFCRKEHDLFQNPSVCLIVITRVLSRLRLPPLSQILHVPLKLLHHMAQVAERLTQQCGTTVEPALWAPLRTRNLTSYLVNVSKQPS